MSTKSPQVPNDLKLPSERNVNLDAPHSPNEFVRHIPEYELKTIGKSEGNGAFGFVYKAKWFRGNNREMIVAKKEFFGIENIESFTREVEQLSKVRHKNIVRLYGVSKECKQPYIVMEYSEIGSLSKLLHDSPQNYDLRHATNWALQAARGVAYLHNMKPKPIMHRDLKPQNLLLFDKGKILKICDFGTACPVKTQMTENRGSVCYMAPEVMKASNYTEKGDVFSWAIVLWEVLARRKPYEHITNQYQLMWSVLQHRLRPCQLTNLPKPFEDIVQRCWDNDPQLRYSINEVVTKMEFICELSSSKEAKTEKPTSHHNHNQTQTNQDLLSMYGSYSTPSYTSSEDLNAHSNLHIPRLSIEIPYTPSANKDSGFTEASMVADTDYQRKILVLQRKIELLTIRLKNYDEENDKDPSAKVSEADAFSEYRDLKLRIEKSKELLNAKNLLQRRPSSSRSISSPKYSDSVQTTIAGPIIN